MAKADRRWIDPLDVATALTQPVRRERQADGRVRYWAYIPRLGTYIRVVTLPDGETVHNVFKDSDFYRMSADFDYDPGTDSLYIKLRSGESVGNRILSDDVVIDLGADGEPVGYDIQHASRHADAIAEALGYLHQRHAA
jgi:uncharacterized protein YuzE